MNFRMLGRFIIFFALGSVAGMVTPTSIRPAVYVALVLGTALSFGVVDLVTGRRKIRRDRHPFPHRLNSRGGCACNCERCTKETNGTIRCVCPRCNQDCPAIGRLGDADAVRKERPITYGVPARKWYVQ